MPLLFQSLGLVLVAIVASPKWL